MGADCKETPTAVLLIRHLLVGLNNGEREQLEEEFRDLRTIRLGEENIKYINYNGKEVDSPDKIQLPPQI